MADAPTFITREALQRALSRIHDGALSAFRLRGKRPLFAVPGVILFLSADGDLLPATGQRFLTRADLHHFTVEDLLEHTVRLPTPNGAAAAVIAVALRLDGDLHDQVNGEPHHLLLHAMALTDIPGVRVVSRHAHPLSPEASTAKGTLVIEQLHDQLRHRQLAAETPAFASARRH